MKNFLLLLCVAMLFTACSGNERMDVMFECPSPSGTKIATLYRIAHGDNPINHEMYINIRYADSAFEAGLASFSFQQGYDAIIAWQSDHAMTITYPLDSALTHQETVVFGSSKIFRSSDTIQIHYQQKSSTHGYFIIEQRCFQQSLQR